MEGKRSLLTEKKGKGKEKKAIDKSFLVGEEKIGGDHRVET